jgi:hypothetical protein
MVVLFKERDIRILAFKTHPHPHPHPHTLKTKRLIANSFFFFYCSIILELDTIAVQF